MSTEQKVAIVTGASQGIGAGILQAFRDRNYRVVATSRSIKPAADSDVVTVQGDIGAADTAERVFKTAFERFGRVDTLVNNAGMFMAKPFTMYTPDDYALYMSTNVTSFFHMNSACAGIYEQTRTRPRRHDYNKPCRPADEQCPGRVGVSHKGSAERRNESACNRVCEDRSSSQRSVTGNNQDADAPAASPSSAGGAPSNGTDGRGV